MAGRRMLPCHLRWFIRATSGARVRDLRQRQKRRPEAGGTKSDRLPTPGLKGRGRLEMTPFKSLATG
jgi:hypothetical protein